MRGRGKQKVSGNPVGCDGRDCDGAWDREYFGIIGINESKW